ncbi:YrrS family protein [Peribacillus deserti]|uniref:DNA primase n=1 Tax=Peribacillus deserti TaxID=673318 RepID=A0A2N5M965_9BACI|nr:YrrS family protein [Peribacillus deserti]PLT30906.1 DNA primase [Peribacillus deserti]
MDRDLNKTTTRIDKTKQRKANRIYNILIVIVSVLILSVAAFIFLGGGSNQASKETKSETPKTEAASKDDNRKEKEKAAKKNEEEKVDLSSRDLESAKESDPDKVTEVSDNDANVKRAYTNESWKPVGTTQQGEHTASYDQGSVDWKEMEKALAYGSKIDPANLTVWWIENNGTPNSAVGTVSAKDNDQAYRVHIEWVDGQGWKPVKVQELKVNDKK